MTSRKFKRKFISIKEAESKYMKDEKGYFQTSDLGSYSNESLIHLHKEGQIYVTNNGRVKLKMTFQRLQKDPSVLSTTKNL